MSDQDDRKFDVRTIDRKLGEAELSKDELEEYREDLPDVSDNAVELEAEFEEDVLEEDEEDQEADEAEASDQEDEEDSDEDEE